MLVKLNQISTQYLGKIMVAFFLMSILEAIVSSTILSPAMNIMRQGGSGYAVKSAVLFLCFVSICIFLTFQFGFSVMLLKMSRREYTDLGFLFIGFRRFNPAGKVVIAFALLLSALSVISAFIARFVFLKLKPDFSFDMEKISEMDISELQASSEKMSDFLSQAVMDVTAFIGLFLLILFLFFLLILLRFIFVFQLHFDNPRDSVFALFKRSGQMMHKKLFKFILFAIKAGGKQLLVAVVLTLVVSFIPAAPASGLSVLVFLLNLICFFNFYTAVLRIYLTVPVMYNWILNPSEPDEEPVLEISESGENEEK